MLKNNKGFTAIELMIAIVGLVIVPACIYGWCHNIYTLTQLSLDPLTIELILRCIGVVMIPLGVVLGFF